MTHARGISREVSRDYLDRRRCIRERTRNVALNFIKARADRRERRSMSFYDDTLLRGAHRNRVFERSRGATACARDTIRAAITRAYPSVPRKGASG